MWQQYLETHTAAKRRFSPEPQTKWKLNHSGLRFSCLLGFFSLIYFLFTQDWKQQVSHAILIWTVFVWNDVLFWNATSRLIVATCNQDTAPSLSDYLQMFNSSQNMLLFLDRQIVILIMAWFCEIKSSGNERMFLLSSWQNNHDILHLDKSTVTSCRYTPGQHRGCGHQRRWAAHQVQAEDTSEREQ